MSIFDRRLAAALSLVCACVVSARVAAQPAASLSPSATGRSGVVPAGDLCAHDPVLCGKARAAFAAAAQREKFGVDEDPGVINQLMEVLADTDCLNNNLDIAITISPNNITGFNKMTLRSTHDGLTQFSFVLRSQYVISSVVLNEGTPQATTIAGASVTSFGTYGRRINLDRTYNTNEQFTVKVNYSGTPANVGLGSIFFGTFNGKTIACSLSEPYYAASWWPCKDGDFGTAGDNSDKATLDLAITCPNTHKVASNGKLTGTTIPAAGKLRYQYHSDLPISTYLVCFSAYPYNFYTSNYTYPDPANPGQNLTMPFEMYISPTSDTAANRNTWLKSLDVMAAFRPYFGEYPFVSEKYGCYEFTFGGGMEHQTNTGMGGGFSENVTAHELTHQWWGDNVTCKYWNDIWLNEGFATYGEALWAEKKPGSTGTPALLSAMAARRPSSVGGSVYCYDVSNVNNVFSTDNSYYKGGWVLHMLRHVMGDTQFFQIFANVRTLYNGSAYTTTDFQAVAEGIYGSSLSWFFQPWVFGVGAPNYSWASRTATANGKTYLEMYITQTQSASYPTFDMPIDVTYNLGASPTTSVVRQNAAAQYFVIPVSTTPTSVALDPNNYILTGAKAAVSFVEGPPKIVEVSPAPGSSALSNTVSSVKVTFHKNVNATAGAFTLTGASAGSIPFTYSYDSATFTATLTPVAAFPADTITLGVAASITGVAGGLALDGEIANPTSSSSLPSGNGIAGGAATLQFTLTQPPSPCAADYTGAQCLGSVDLLGYLNAYFTPTLRDATPPLGYGRACTSQEQLLGSPAQGYKADYNRDCQLDPTDLLPFLFDYFNPTSACFAGC